MRSWVCTCGNIKNFIGHVKTGAKILLQPETKLCAKEIRDIMQAFSKLNFTDTFSTAVLSAIGGSSDVAESDLSRSQTLYAGDGEHTILP